MSSVCGLLWVGLRVTREADKGGLSPLPLFLLLSSTCLSQFLHTHTPPSPGADVIGGSLGVLETPRGQVSCSARGHRWPQEVTYELGVKDQEDLGSRKGMECGAKRTRVSPWAITPMTWGLALGSSNFPASRNSRRRNTMSPASCKSLGGPRNILHLGLKCPPGRCLPTGWLSRVRPLASLCPEVATSPRELSGSDPEAAHPPDSRAS